MKKKKLNSNEISNTANIIINICFIIYSLICIYPIALVIGISFTDETCLNTIGYRVFPKIVSFDAYKYILSNIKPIAHAYVVTIGATASGTALSTIIIGFYAYAISRPEFRYRGIFTFFIFFTMLFNGGMVAWYMVCTQVIHLQNTYAALVLPSLISAWYVMIMKTFYASSVPDAIIEAARIDGAGEFKTFFRIVMPISIPGFATIALFMMLQYWNDWYLPFMLTSEAQYSNIQLYLKKILNNLQEMLNSAGVAQQSGVASIPREGARMAICALAVGPIILAYPFFQKYIVKGLTVGSVKG